MPASKAPSGRGWVPLLLACARWDKPSGLFPIGIACIVLRPLPHIHQGIAVLEWDKHPIPVAFNSSGEEGRAKLRWEWASPRARRGREWSRMGRGRVELGAAARAAP